VNEDINASEIEINEQLEIHSKECGCNGGEESAYG
jgi:hypothetical protein